MGMFSYIKCKKNLPLTDELKNLSVKWSETQFQTKDLDNCLETYIISEDGELLEEVIEYEYTYYTEEEKKQKDHKPWNIVKDQKIVKQETKKVDFHGKITFYETLDLNDQESVWVDFDAYFVYGKLDKLELAKVEKYENRKMKMDEYWKAYESKQNSFCYKLRKYSGWFWLWKKIEKCCYSMSRFFDIIRYFIIRNIL
jgi:hypothetical protein